MPAFRATDTASLLHAVESRALTHVSLGCLDWDGRLRAKHYSTAHLAAALDHGLAMTTTIFAQDVGDIPIDFGPFEDADGGYADGQLTLDVDSARDAPFDAGGDGLLILGEFQPPYAAFCPRALLRAELARYDALGYTVRGGFELEFRLLNESPQSMSAKSAAELSFAPAFERMYGLVDQAGSSPFVHALEQWAARMDVSLAAVHHEFKGLIETALAAVSGLAIADNAVLVRSLAAILAHREQRLACFMARVAPDLQSAGAHLNLSLWRKEGADKACFAGAAPNPTLRAFIAGLQRYVPELFVLSAPTINAYKRFTPDCIAPRHNTWGINNKTVAYRAVLDDAELARVEIRVPGADVHPHLVLAAMLAAGRMGVQQGLEPSAMCVGDAAGDGAPAGMAFPTSLLDAVALWRRSALAVQCFGAGFVDAYARSREWQWHRFTNAVTDWELQNYARMV